MCVVSFVGDYYKDQFPHKSYWDRILVPTTPFPNTIPASITREEFDDLKKTVLEMKDLLIKAKEIDEKTGQPDCEMEEKVELLRKVAKLVGVELPI
ncbi:MAG TPA: hypothetical protein VFR24_27270 [Candidatus Angelobacter sp.]|nr:hypothetical protein [Candidatus Angelobacter sp.]